MRRLLAVGVINSWEGDWQQAQGNERAFVAAPIGRDEQVWLEVEDRSGTIRSRLQLSAIPTQLDLGRHSRYRVVKDTGGAAATTVEVLLSNGR